MTASPSTASTRSWARPVVLLVVLVAGAAAGAYLDWMWWHPTSGIVVTIGAVALLLLAALAWLSRVTAIRPVALGIGALAVGLLLGQNLGPSRPPVTIAEGEVTVRLTQPANAGEISGRADCQLTPDGENFQIGGDPNLRLQIGDQPLEERDPIQVALARGDMWEYGAEGRDDGWSLRITIGDAGPFTGDEMPVNTTMESDADSQIASDGTQESGSLQFAHLILDEQQSPGAEGPIELAGTISWTCDVPVQDLER